MSATEKAAPADCGSGESGSEKSSVFGAGVGAAEAGVGAGGLLGAGFQTRTGLAGTGTVLGAAAGTAAALGGGASSAPGGGAAGVPGAPVAGATPGVEIAARDVPTGGGATAGIRASVPERRIANTANEDCGWAVANRSYSARARPY